MLLRLQLALLTLLIAGAVCSQNVRMTYTFEAPEFIERHDGFVEPVMNNCLNLAGEGQPLLPAFSAQILLPQGKEIAGVKIISIEYADPITPVSIVPASRPFPFSEPAPADYKPAPVQDIYQSSRSFPASVISDVSTQFLLFSRSARWSTTLSKNHYGTSYPSNWKLKPARQQRKSYNLRI